MPRYHFNIYNGGATIDAEGSQIDNIAIARLEAMRIASELLGDEAMQQKLGDEWRVEVTDRRGMILFRIDIVISASAAVG